MYVVWRWKPEERFNFGNAPLIGFLVQFISTKLYYCVHCAHTLIQEQGQEILVSEKIIVMRCGVVLNRLIKSHYDFSSHSFRPFHSECLRRINIFIYVPLTSNFHSTSSYFALLYNLWLTSTRVFLPQIKSIGHCTLYTVYECIFVCIWICFTWGG